MRTALGTAARTTWGIRTAPESPRVRGSSSKARSDARGTAAYRRGVGSQVGNARTHGQGKAYADQWGTRKMREPGVYPQRVYEPECAHPLRSHVELERGSWIKVRTVALEKRLQLEPAPRLGGPSIFEVF